MTSADRVAIARALFFIPVLVILAAAVFGAPPTRAAEDAGGTVVSVPVGDVAAALGEWAGPILTAAVLWVLRQLPGEAVAMLRMIRFEQLVERSVDAAIAATAGAARGRTLDVETGSAVLAEAARLAIRSAPRLVEWAGGDEAIRYKILARLDVDPSAGAAGPDAALRLVRQPTR